MVKTVIEVKVPKKAKLHGKLKQDEIYGFVKDFMEEFLAEYDFRYCACLLYDYSRSKVTKVEDMRKLQYRDWATVERPPRELLQTHVKTTSGNGLNMTGRLHTLWLQEDDHFKLGLYPKNSKNAHRLEALDTPTFKVERNVFGYFRRELDPNNKYTNEDLGLPAKHALSEADVWGLVNRWRVSRVFTPAKPKPPAKSREQCIHAMQQSAYFAKVRGVEHTDPRVIAFHDSLRSLRQHYKISDAYDMDNRLPSEILVEYIMDAFVAKNPLFDLLEPKHKDGNAALKNMYLIKADCLKCVEECLAGVWQQIVLQSDKRGEKVQTEDSRQRETDFAKKYKEKILANDAVQEKLHKVVDIEMARELTSIESELYNIIRDTLNLLRNRTFHNLVPHCQILLHYDADNRQMMLDKILHRYESLKHFLDDTKLLDLLKNPDVMSHAFFYKPDPEKYQFKLGKLMTETLDAGVTEFEKRMLDNLEKEEKEKDSKLREKVDEEVQRDFQKSYSQFVLELLMDAMLDPVKKILRESLKDELRPLARDLWQESETLSVFLLFEEILAKKMIAVIQGMTSSRPARVESFSSETKNKVELKDEEVLENHKPVPPSPRPDCRGVRPTSPAFFPPGASSFFTMEGEGKYGDTLSPPSTSGISQSSSIDPVSSSSSSSSRMDYSQESDSEGGSAPVSPPHATPAHTSLTSDSPAQVGPAAANPAPDSPPS